MVNSILNATFRFDVETIVCFRLQRVREEAEEAEDPELGLEFCQGRDSTLI